ncbi:MAG: hypothetical protein K2H87_00310 [Duncaniella sp.]|nr:hypothetical protein [Duncaniella sp.]
MVIALLALSPVATVSAFNVQGDGSEESPWLISSTEDWNDLAQMMIDETDMLEDCFIKLTADIDFTGKEMMVLGTSSLPFAGTLDGDSKTIKGFALTGTAEYAAPISQLAAAGTIKNVTFEGSVTSNKSYVGGVVGHLKGTMENVVSNVTLTQTTNSTNYVGGVAAKIYAGAKLKNCVFKGSAITKYTNAGGMTGIAEGNILFDGCGNEGTVGTSVTSSTNVYVGGLCGVALPCEFINCYNSGTISVAASNSQVVGGLVGQFNGDTEYMGQKYVMTGCYNTSDIKGAFNIGGLIGMIGTYGRGSYHGIEMTDCYNSGNIEGTSVNKYTVSTGVGGLVSVGVGNSTYTGCYNTGNITTNRGRVGGLFGSFQGTITGSNPVTITGCYNTGNISTKSTYGAGGLAHDMCAYSTVENCYNTGNVTTTGNKAGGLFATATGAELVIKGCYNTGTITSAGNVGGLLYTGGSNQGKMESCFNSGAVVGGTGNTIGGLAGNYAGEIRDCYNAGDVSGASKIGGLIGTTSKGSSATNKNTSLYNCYNMGKVTATTPASAGNVIGVSLAAEGNNWTEYNVIENTYYLLNGSDAELNDGVQGVDMAQLCGVKPLAAAEAVAAEADENQTYLSLGEGWLSNQACTPVLAWADDETLLNSINVFYEEGGEILPVNEDVTITTSSFMVGNPAETQWASTGAAVDVEGTTATFTESVNGEFVLTATLGDKTRSFNLKGNRIVTGLDEVNASKDAVNHVWYDLSGVAVSAPADADGKVYIVVTTYSDGTVSAEKVLNQ